MDDSFKKIQKKTHRSPHCKEAWRVHVITKYHVFIHTVNGISKATLLIFLFYRVLFFFRKRVPVLSYRSLIRDKRIKDHPLLSFLDETTISNLKGSALKSRTSPCVKKKDKVDHLVLMYPF